MVRILVEVSPEKKVFYKLITLKLEIQMSYRVHVFFKCTATCVDSTEFLIASLQQTLDYAFSEIDLIIPSFNSNCI